MGVDFKGLIADLRSLVICLKERCSIAESKLEQQKTEIESLQKQIAKLESDNREIMSKYKNLQTGMTQGRSAEEISELKEKYLALVREIDDCIRIMQHGR